MQRRNLLIGMGSLAAGGAAAIGTSATSSGTDFDRSSSIVVAQTDAGATIALVEGEEDSDFVSYDSNGRLNIDLSQSGGVNPDSTYKIGTQSNPAFTLENNSPDSQIIEFNYNLDNFSDIHNNFDGQITFIFYGVDAAIRDRNSTFAMWLGSGAGRNPDHTTSFKIGSGSSVGVTMAVKPGPTAGGADLSGDMEFDVVDSFPAPESYQ
jgi:hypothetical protein